MQWHGETSVQGDFIRFQGPVRVPVTSREFERFNDRSYGFSEQVGHWDLPMHEGGVVTSAAVGPGKERVKLYFLAKTVNGKRYNWKYQAIVKTPFKILISDLAEDKPSSVGL